MIAARYRDRALRRRSRACGRTASTASAPTCASGCAARPRTTDGWVPRSLRALVRLVAPRARRSRPGERPDAGRDARAACSCAARSTSSSVTRAARCASPTTRPARPARPPTWSSAAGRSSSRSSTRSRASSCSPSRSSRGGSTTARPPAASTERVVALDDHGRAARAGRSWRSSDGALARGLPARRPGRARLHAGATTGRSAGRTKRCARNASRSDRLADARAAAGHAVTPRRRSPIRRSATASRPTSTRRWSSRPRPAPARRRRWSAASSRRSPPGAPRSTASSPSPSPSRPRAS